jgi:hypothetical protein
MKTKLAVPWVTGVLCVNEDKPPRLEGKIWVVGHADIVPWLQAQRNTSTDCARVRTVLAPPAAPRRSAVRGLIDGSR